MRRLWTVAVFVVVCFGCDDGSVTGGTGGSGGKKPPPTPAPPNDIHFDLSGLNRYVTGSPPKYTIAGKVTASHGIDHVTVGGMNTTLMGDSFSGDVAVMTGLVPVPIQAFDRAQHSRKGDRALIVAPSFLPEGQTNPGAAALTLTDAMLQAAAAPLAQEIQSLSVADQVMARPTLSQDSQCTTWPVSARQDPTQFALTRDAQTGHLVVHVTVPNLYVNFAGQCMGLIQEIPITGHFSTTIQMSSELTPIAPAAGQCLHAFNHSAPAVTMGNWQFSVQGQGLGGILVDLFGGNQGPTARDNFQQQFTQQADQMLTMRLGDVNLFDKDQTMDMKGVSITVGMCLQALDTSGGQLRAIVGAKATGPGGLEAPGAPQFAGAMPAATASTLLLDTNLVSQLLFSSWRGGGLNADNVQMVDVSLLALLAPGLSGRYPDGTMATVSAHADLPPVVHAATPGMGDMTLELGDLLIDLKVGDELLFRLGANLKLTMELVPMGSALVPMVTAVEGSSHLLEAPIAGVPDDVIERVIDGKLKDAAPTLVGSSPINLPQIGSITLTPHDVVAVPGGRYLKITLQ